MKPTLVIPKRPGVEYPPPPEIEKGIFVRDESISQAVEDYLEARSVEENAASLVAVARKELEAKLRNRNAVECAKYRVVWKQIYKASYWMPPQRTRPLRVFEKEAKKDA